MKKDIVIADFVENSVENSKDIAGIKDDKEMIIFKFKLTELIDNCMKFVKTKEYKKCKKNAPLVAYAFAVGWKEGQNHKNRI